MKILDNSEKGYCPCLGEEYTIYSTWGLGYCIIDEFGECHDRAVIGTERRHSKEAIQQTPDLCPSCGRTILQIIKHPIKRRE